jgi:hypothetical protein
VDQSSKGSRSHRMTPNGSHRKREPFDLFWCDMFAQHRIAQASQSNHVLANSFIRVS